MLGHNQSERTVNDEDVGAVQTSHAGPLQGTMTNEVSRQGTP